MASACVNNVSVSTYGCFNPRAASFSREDARSSKSTSSEIKNLIPPTEEEFEFMSGDTLGMLPADELFSDGKFTTKQQHTTVPAVVEAETGGNDSFLVSSSHKATPRWWKLKRFSQNSTASFKQFLNRTPKTTSSSDDASLISLPLLSDSESSLSVSSSRMSLSSSSSSSHDHDDTTTPRLSLDAERLNHLANHTITANPFAPARPRMRLVKKKHSDDREDVSVDSPRLNSSGKIVFQSSLERSSSSPSGGYRNRGVERNVRVAPVLNVPVCSVRGGSVVFSQFFSSGSNHRASTHHHSGGGVSRGRNSTDRVS